MTRRFFVKNTLAKNCCRHESVEELDKIPLVLRFSTHLSFSLTMREVPQSPLQGPLGSSAQV